MDRMTTVATRAIPLPEPLPPIPESEKEGVLIGAACGAAAGAKLGQGGGLPLMLICAGGGALVGALFGRRVGSWMEED